MNNLYTKLTTLLLLFVASFGIAYANDVKVDPVSVAPKQQVTISIAVTIDEDITDNVFDMFVFLPEGMSFYNSQTEEGKAPIYGKFTDKVTIDGNSDIYMKSNGSLEILGYGMQIPKGEYVIATFDVITTDDFKEGNIKFKEIMLGDDDLDDFEVKAVATTDAISSVASAPAEACAVYTLSGMQVSEPVKGIYIKDGKKFVK